MCLASAFFVSKKQPIDINQTFTRVFLHKNEEKITTYQEILYLCRRKTGFRLFERFNTKQQNKNNATKSTINKQRNDNNQNENHKSNYQL